MFDQEFFDGIAKHFSVFADLGRNTGQVGMYINCQGIALTHAEGKLAPLGNLAHDNTEVGDGVLDSLLQFTQMTSSILDTGQGDKQTEDVISALENSENPQITHDLHDGEKTLH